MNRRYVGHLRVVYRLLDLNIPLVTMVPIPPVFGADYQCILPCLCNLCQKWRERISFVTINEEKKNTAIIFRRSQKYFPSVR